jgi:hypothetical protein
MNSWSNRLALAALFSLLFLPACQFGRVNQGRVIAFDRAKGLVTLITDSNYADPAKPKFEALPPISVRIPADPNDMGPEPAAGLLMELDCGRQQAVIFDAAAGRFRTVAFTLLEKSDDVSPNHRRVAGIHFPVIDRAARAITVYLPAQRRLVRLSVAEEDLSLPQESWRAGDDVRYYYRDPAQALRLMNVTKTEISSRR